MRPENTVDYLQVHRNGVYQQPAAFRLGRWFEAIAVALIMFTLFGIAAMLWEMSSLMVDLRGVKDDVRAIQERNEKSGPAEVERLKLVDAMRKREITLEVQLVREQEEALRSVREMKEELRKAKRGEE